MGTIAQKLEYLNTTKSKLKDSINALGGEIDNDTTFREYAEELDTIYSNLPKVTGEGSNISLSPTLKGKLDLEYEGDIYQETLTGKNLYNVRDYYNATGSGLTTTYNEDGSLTTTGVPTTDYAIVSRNFELDDILDDGASYTISSPTYVTYVYIQVQIKNKNTSTSTYLSATSEAKTFVVDKNTYTYILRIQSSTRANWGTSSRTITNYYQLEKGSTATSYEPYCGGIPSPNPNYPQDIQVVTGEQEVEICGRNIWNEDWQLGAINSSGQIVTSSNQIISKDKIKVNPSTTYYAYNGDNTYSLYIFQYDKNDNLITYAGQLNRTFTTNASTDYIRFYVNSHTTYANNICINVSDSLNGTYSPYTSQTYTLHLGDLELAKIPNTTYQDKIFIAEEGNEVYDSLTQEQKANLTLGKWYKYGAIGKYTLTGNETFVTSSSTSSRTYYGVDYSENGIYQYSDQTSLPDFLCEKFTRRTQAGSFVPGQVSLLVSSKYVDFIFNPDTTEQQARTILTGMKSYFRLANASTTEITNETLLSDLEYIRTHAMSYSGSTNISISGNLPIVISASALKGE